MSGPSPLLEAIDLRRRYRRRTVVDGVSFAVGAGEIVGLFGPNGAGKTTTFNMVAGLVEPDGGHVLLAGQPLDGLPLYKRARLGLGYLPQESTILRGLSARDNLLAVAEGRGVRGAALAQQVDGLLADYNLVHVADQGAVQLSGGERRRLEIARALICRPRVLLLDEPFAGVDPIATAEIGGLICGLKARGVAVLLTDHNVREPLKFCDRVYLFADGRVMLAGTPAEVIADATARATYLGADFRL